MNSLTASADDTPVAPTAFCRQWAAVFLLVVLGVCVGGRGLAEAPSNQDCLGCHEDQALTKKVDGKSVSLAVKPDALDKSVHKGLACTDCHAGVKEVPHPEKLPPAQCASCHDAVAKEYAGSIHGVSHAMGASGSATCADCHGAHEILSVKDSRSPVFKLNLPGTCARCHSNLAVTSEYQMKYPQAAAQYMESIHGRALLQLGLTVAPSCNNCHGVHNIRRSVDRDSTINHANIAKTCGTCHVGVEKVYDESIHGQLLAKGDKRVPVCTDCHTAHQIETAVGGHFKAVSDQRCGRCHEDRLARYRETYHGKAMMLGTSNKAPEVAACYDCHGYHDVLPRSDPRSRLSPANIVHTCKQCHPRATPRFTEYLAHADPLDWKNYPILYVTFMSMTALLIGVFCFFGLHTAFWLFRSGYLFLHDSKTFRAARIHAERDDEWFVRFTPFERFLHFLVVTSFLLLVITGMPLKFYYTDWAKFMFQILGGSAVARTLHHFAALITFLYFGLHLVDRAKVAWRGRARLRDPETGKLRLKCIWAVVAGPDSMVPNMGDWREFVAHQKWFFGKGPRPQFDRWTYWEKFDYFAVFWGVAIIGASGLVMWFPEFFSHFLPGWTINVALIVHSDEALLAAGFIFTFHFFNVHFRLEKFPMDPVIFSGRISKTEMLHERRRWFDRLTAAKQLDEHRLSDEWAKWQNIAKSFGYMFFGLGLLLLVLIVLAMGSRLLH